MTESDLYINYLSENWRAVGILCCAILHVSSFYNCDARHIFLSGGSRYWIDLVPTNSTTVDFFKLPAWPPLTNAPEKMWFQNCHAVPPLYALWEGLSTLPVSFCNSSFSITLLSNWIAVRGICIFSDNQSAIIPGISRTHWATHCRTPLTWSRERGTIY